MATRFDRLLDMGLGVLSLIVGSGVGVGGVLLLGVALLGLIQGMHGGVVAAGIMIIFGAGLAFVGFYGARYGHRLVRKDSRAATPEDGVAS